MANNKNMKMIYNNIIMTHQPNKHFNTYKEGLDLVFLREYCMEHGGTADVPAGRDTGGGGRAGTVGGVRGTGLLQVHGSQRRGGQGLLHGLRLRGRVRVRLPLLPRRRRVGGEHRGGHAVRGARHQRTGAANC